MVVELLAGTDTFANSFGKLNNSVTSLEEAFYGPTEPTRKTPGKLWVDSANALHKRRNAANTAWIVEGVFGSTYMGLLPRDGSEAMSGDLDMGSQKITNLAAPVAANDAVRNTDLDLYAQLAGAAFTAVPSSTADPVAGNDLVRRSWADAEYMKADGSGGALATPPSVLADATLGDQLVRLSQLQTFALFDTGTGHDHDGVNSKRVDVTDIEHNALAENQPILTGPSNRLKIGKSTSLRFVTATTHPELFNHSAAVAEGAIFSQAAVGAQIVLLKLRFDSDNGTRLNLFLRKDSGDTQASYWFTVPSGAGQFTSVVTAYVEVDASRNFLRQVTQVGGGSASVVCNLIGWFEI